MSLNRRIPCQNASRRRRAKPEYYAAIGLLLALLLQLWLASFTAPKAYAATAEPKIDAPSAIAIDVADGRILFGRDIHQRSAMASTTKIMTALTAVSIPGFNLDDKYKTIKDDLVGEASMGLREGETVTVLDLLYGMLLNSGNDAAVALARYSGGKLPGNGDPIAKFVAQMNLKATEYGLHDSHYANPHGLDQDGHYSSAFDLAVTGWYLLKDPLLSKIVATPAATRAGKDLRSLNKFLSSYRGANGIKPGQTDAAGLCLVSSATRNGSTVIAVVLKEDSAGYNSDPAILTDYGFAKIQEGVVTTGGASDTVDYLGKVSGNKLLLSTQATNAANPLQVIGGDFNLAGAPINAQVISGTVSPDLQLSTGTPGGSDNNSSQKKDGGVNFFLIVLLLILVLVAVWFAARMGLIAGDNGRDFAYMVQDGVVSGSRIVGKYAGKLWHNLKPGDSDQPEKAPPEKPVRNQESLRDRVQSNRTAPTEPPLKRPIQSAPTTQTNTADYTFNDNTKVRSRMPKPNPLENIFDEAEVPNFGNPVLNEQPSQAYEASLQPPPPLSTRPPTSARPATPPPAIPSYSKDPEPVPTTADNLAARARHAIDYAIAGRMLASTDEFRRVVEHNPAFDFGNIPEFEQMPVLGYKALANAYQAVGRTKFGVLLLDMAIEKFPNDLELRNMFRVMSRELGGK